MDFRHSRQRNLVKSLYLDPEVLNNHNLTLKAKYERMKREEIRFETYNTGGHYQALIVSYGTMSRVCRTAIDLLKDQGIPVGMIRPQTLFPFPEKAVFDAACQPGCKAVASIEMNMGQMVEDIERSVKGKQPVSWFGKCGGDVPTPEEVQAFITQLIGK
jgi:2-oxoglutarate ferredoxin oxidoreductase subunit alpha